MKNITGQKIKELRLAAGMSQRRMAIALQLVGLDVDKNTIWRIEAGKRHVGDLELRAIRQILGVSYNEIFGE